MRFEWDVPKARENLRKHGVSFEEACAIFADRSVLTAHDVSHSRGEDRWASIGMSASARVLVVIHTWPDPDESGDELMRIISARKANRREQAVYFKRKQ